MIYMLNMSPSKHDLIMMPRLLGDLLKSVAEARTSTFTKLMIKMYQAYCLEVPLAHMDTKPRIYCRSIVAEALKMR